MTFTRIAEAERRGIAAERLKKEMEERGWCSTDVSVQLLSQLEIPYEAADPLFRRRGQAMGSPEGVVLYVPAWVAAAYRWTTMHSRPDILETMLRAMRDDPQEQEMMCKELSLATDVTRNVRRAAHNFRRMRN